MKQTHRSRVKARSAIFFIVGTVIILLACVTTVFYQSQLKQSTHAADLTFVGSPTLPASTVDRILARTGSPMVGVGAVVEQAARKDSIDDAFALAVWEIETSDGAAGVGRTALNPGGVRSSSGYPVGPGGYTLYSSYADGVSDWFDLVKSRYVDHGLTSVYTLCVPYVGTSSSYLWAAKVTNLMLSYRDEAPPPTPTPVVQSTLHISADSQVVQDAKKQVALQTKPTAPAKVTHTTTPSTVQSTSHSQQQSQAAIQHQPLLFVAILLAAIGLALSALQLERRKVIMPAQEAVQKSYNPITPLPALYVNQYSPIREREPETGPQIPIAPMFAPAFSGLPLRLPSLAEPDYNRAQLLRLPSLSEPDSNRDRPRQAIASGPAGGGLLKRYGTTENLTPRADPMPVVSVPQYGRYYQPQPQSVRTTEDLWYSQFVEVSPQQLEFQENVTEDLWYSQSTTVFQSQPEPERVAVPVAAPRSGSVLRSPRRLISLPTENF